MLYYPFMIALNVVFIALVGMTTLFMKIYILPVILDPKASISDRLMHAAAFMLYAGLLVLFVCLAIGMQLSA